VLGLHFHYLLPIKLHIRGVTRGGAKGAYAPPHQLKGPHLFNNKKIEGYILNNVSYVILFGTLLIIKISCSHLHMYSSDTIIVL